MKVLPFHDTSHYVGGMGSTPKAPLDHDPGAVASTRMAAGLTKTDVARELGVSLSLVSMIESGDRNATPETIEAMAQVFRCSPDDLKRKDGSPGTRLAVVCAQCSGLWKPDHACPNVLAALAH